MCPNTHWSDVYSVESQVEKDECLQQIESTHKTAHSDAHFKYELITDSKAFGM